MCDKKCDCQQGKNTEPRAFTVRSGSGIGDPSWEGVRLSDGSGIVRYVAAKAYGDSVQDVVTHVGDLDKYLQSQGFGDGSSSYYKLKWLN